MGQDEQMERKVHEARAELGVFEYLVVGSSDVASSTGNRACLIRAWRAGMLGESQVSRE